MIITKIRRYLGICVLIMFIIPYGYSQLSFSIDTSFGNNGIVTTTVFPKGYHGNIPTLLQPDGKILTASNFAKKAIVARYLPNGELDNDWGEGGISAVNPGFNQVIVLNDISLLSDGKLIVLGLMDSITQTSPFTPFNYLFRLNTNGSLDTTFGNNGFVFLDFTTNNSFFPTNIVIIDSLIILIGTGGELVNMTNYRLLALKQSNGSVDTTWGNNGVLTFGITSFGQATVIKSKRQIDNKILITNKDYFIRVLPNGQIDSTLNSNLGFGVKPTVFANGILPNNMQNGQGGARGISIFLQNDNKILFAGIAEEFSPYVGLGIVERYNNDGTIDSSFANDGVLLVDFRIEPSHVNIISDIAMSNEGNIIVVGNIIDIISGATYFAMAHYDEHGELMENIGNNGVYVLNSFHMIDSIDLLYNVIIQPDNKILLSGCTPLYSTSTDSFEYLNSFNLARFQYVNTEQDTTTTSNEINFPQISNIILYPNPTKELVSLSYQLNSNGIIKIAIYNIEGKLVQSFQDTYQFKGVHQILLNLSTSFSTGSYFIVIDSQHNEKYIGKLIIE